MSILLRIDEADVADLWGLAAEKSLQRVNLPNS
jgi:hypothetical protein